MGNSEELERRIANLEARQELMIDVLCALADKVQLEAGHFALLALNCGFTAQELADLHDFFGWALTRGSADDVREFDRGTEHEPSQDPSARSSDGSPVPVTREEIKREFEARLPGWKNSLELIMQAHRADGQFPELCRIVLGEDKVM